MIVIRAFTARCDLHEWLTLVDNGSVRCDRVLLYILRVANMDFYVTDDEEIDGPLPIPGGSVDSDEDSVSTAVTDDEESTDEDVTRDKFQDLLDDYQEEHGHEPNRELRDLVTLYRLSLSTPQICSRLLLTSTERFEQLIEVLKGQRRDMVDMIIRLYPNLENERIRRSYRQKLKQLLTPETNNNIIEGGGGVVPEALKFHLECMDRKHPCLRGEHRCKRRRASSTPEGDATSPRRIRRRRE